MDDATLAGLVLAYQTAPSPELAKILLLAQIKKGQAEAALSYLEAVPDRLQVDEYCQIAKGFLGLPDTSPLIKFLVRTEVDSQAVIQHLAEQDDKAAADLYQRWVACKPAVKSAFLEKRLGLGGDGENGRPKLKVVEKANMADVTDLARYKEATVTFADVVGLEDIKKQIDKKIIMPFQRPVLFQKFRKKVGGGVLLFGPPGCGKTLLARATAGQCRANFFNIEISDVLDMYIGESEQKLHAIFEKARQQKPSVLFFDELEALAGKREHSRNSSSSNIVSQFLTELDGFSQNNEGILVLASTNVPWSIDAAFLRPGRFDRMFFVPPPDRVAREAILRHHMKDRPQSNDIDFAFIAGRTGGYSGADLANLVDMATDEAIDASIAQGGDQVINFQHFQDALKISRPTTLEWLTTARNYARYANDGGRYNDVLDFLNKHGK